LIAGVSVKDGEASFDADSTTMTAQEFSSRIGVAPPTSAEIGDPVGRGRSGRRHTTASCSWDFSCGDGARAPLDAVLGMLIETLEPALPVLDEMRGIWTDEVGCHGSSNSEQGGFWLGRPVADGLSRLGAAFFCTVYLAEDIMRGHEDR
jgi:hypothetical protein